MRPRFCYVSCETRSVVVVDPWARWWFGKTVVLGRGSSGCRVTGCCAWEDSRVYRGGTVKGRLAAAAGRSICLSRFAGRGPFRFKTGSGGNGKREVGRTQLEYHARDGPCHSFSNRSSMVYTRRKSGSKKGKGRSCLKDDQVATTKFWLKAIVLLRILWRYPRRL